MRGFSRKLGLFVLSAVSLCALMTFGDTETVDGLTWNYDVSGREASLKEYTIPTSTMGEIVIPSRLGGYPVTRIGVRAFRDCGGLTDVIIPDSVRSIGSVAFYNCSRLSSITIPNSVTNIDSGAFRGCGWMTNMVLPFVGFQRGNKEDKDAQFGFIFGGGSYTGGIAVRQPSDTAAWFIPANLKKVVITDESHIADYAFFNCTMIENLTIPGSVTNIGTDAFFNCSGLREVHITDLTAWCKISLCNVYSNPFSYSKGFYVGDELVTDLVIPNGVSSIGNYTFYNCSSLTSIKIPDSTIELSDSAFDGCGKLWTNWYRKLNQISSDNGSSAGNTPGDARYALSGKVADRAVATVTVSGDTALDEFVLTEGKVYDTVLRVVNTSESAVKLTLPAGYEYETFKGARPLVIPAKSRNIVTLTRTAERVFLVTREELATVQ